MSSSGSKGDMLWPKPWPPQWGQSGGEGAMTGQGQENDPGAWLQVLCTRGTHQ